MKRMSTKFFLGLVFLLSACRVFSEVLPIEYFARLPDFRSTQLSPDGARLVGVVTMSGESVVATFDLDTGDMYLVIRTDNEDAKINWVRWGNSERLLLGYRAPAIRYGVRTSESRLMSIRYDGTDRKNMFRVGNRDQWFPQIQDHLVDVLSDDEEHFLLALDDQSPGAYGLYRVNIETGTRKLVERRVGNTHDWLVDQQGQPRVVITHVDGSYRVFLYDLEGKNRRLVWQFESFSEDAVWPMGFGLDPNILYVRSYYQGRYAVFRVDVNDPDLKLDLILSDEYRDVEGKLIRSARSGEVIGVYYAGGEGLHYFWEESYKNFMAAIDRALPDTSNALVGLSKDENRYLIYSSNDVTPGVFYLGDVQAKTLEIVGENYPELGAVSLSPKKRMLITARDDLELEAFLTVPAGSSEEGLPTIVFPHGGPISRDGAGFDYWTQFFADRGYAVLQVNFRGSSGYGFDFMKAGLQNYGLSMQNDLEDSTHWLIDNGISDPNRICIVGGSYGGYAALVGVAKSPDLYACAVSFAGLSDLNRFLTDSKFYTDLEIVREQLGSDRQQLRETSPRRMIDSIMAPILLAHGGRDRVVPVEQSQAMKAALDRAGKEFEYLEFDDGDHYLSNANHRLEFFQAMDAFLAKNLGPGQQASVE